MFDRGPGLPDTRGLSELARHSRAQRISAISLVLAILYGLGFANLFLRASFGVLTPDLARELMLEPAMLSAIGSAFFFAYAVMQVPTGMLFDRVGAQRTLAAMLVFSTIGTALFAVGTSPATLIGARVLMGIGLAGVFTGGFVILSNWLPPDRLVSQIGAMNSFATLGTICATTPFAVLLGWIGWRASYWLFAAIIALIAAVIWLLLRDAPSDRPRPSAKPETLREAFGGVVEAARQPGMGRLLVAGLPMSCSSVVSGIWGAPYLKDVHGFDDIARSGVLLAMAGCALGGHFSYGQLARRLNTVRGVVLAGGTGALLVSGTLALVSSPPAALVITLFCCLGFASAYPTVTYAHARGLVPARLLGRAVATTNMGIMSAIAVMQLVFGFILGWLSGDTLVPSEGAYRAAFAVQALVTIAALLVYAPIQDVKPRG